VRLHTRLDSQPFREEEYLLLPVRRHRAEAKVLQDLPYRELIGQECDHLHVVAAADADERVHLVDLGYQAPGRRSRPTRAQPVGEARSNAS